MSEQRHVVVVKMSADAAIAATAKAISRVGKVNRKQETLGLVEGRVRSGHLNMNRANLTIRVEPVSDSESKLIFQATAREGMHFQNTAAKAIARVLELVGLV